MSAACDPALTVLIVAKEPIPGRVKTRLTPSFTPEQAAALAEAAIADTLAAVGALRSMPGVRPVRPLLVLDGAAGPWLPVEIEIIPQVSGPFDVRLAAAFDAVDGPALLIGMDTPQVTPQLLADAAAALTGADAVFGPAADGGWWALGLRHPHGRLLRGVETSRPDTGARQLERLAGAGLSVATLPVLRDVDLAEDADEVARLAPSGRFAAVLRSVRTADAATDSARPAGTAVGSAGAVAGARDSTVAL